MFKIKNNYLVEINIPNNATGTRVYFPDIPKLRDKFITGADAVNSSVLSISPNGNTIIGNARALLVTLVTVDGGNQEAVFQMPYYDLVASLNGGIVKQFNRLKVNMQKSYLFIADGSLITAGHSAAIVFYYE